MLKDEYTLAQVGFGTAEKDPSKVCYKGLAPYTYNFTINSHSPVVAFY